MISHLTKVHGQFRGKYLAECHKCGEESTQYGEPIFPFTGPPALYGRSQSEYDRSYHELKEETGKTEAEIERLINLRGNVGYDSHIIEEAIKRNWRHIKTCKTCKMWMIHVYGNEYREFFE